MFVHRTPWTLNKSCGEPVSWLAKVGVFPSVVVTALVCTFLFAGLVVASSFSQSPPPDTDTGAAPDPGQQATKLDLGAYYWTGMAWEQMEPVTWSANGVRRTGKSSVWSYRRPKARVQLAGQDALFCYRVAVAPGGSQVPPSFNIVIARLEQKKDLRQLETKNDTGAFALNAGLPKERTLEVAVTDASPGVLLISPKVPLLPGEYVLGDSSLAITGYDFGVLPVK